MKKLIVMINFKTYKQGRDVVKLAEKIQEVRKDIIIGVQASDIYKLSKDTSLKIFAEHVDYFEPGRHTGFIIPEAVKKDGAKGVFLNHSEHRISFNTLKKTIKRCKEIKLKTAVFAGSSKEAKKVEKLKPDYLIYEPPELVGGKVSVSKSKPEVISKIAKELKMKFLVGAGIKSREDVNKAVELGASGIAVSSGVVKSKNPKKRLRELIG